ncbi:MAG: betaine/proline/choline family ABC transporter ATP-binding protein [Kosmotoga sp.]|nr:MAG: betaine/proline/choline family ABC transporter ATP-binding protein [Kosmotoga sp.]
MSTAIKVKDLWKIYSDIHDRDIDVEDEELIEKIEKMDEPVIAVRDVSFEVKEGEVFVIMGLSGSGKSTLIRCLLRLLEPTSGEIQIDDYKVTDLSDDELINFRRKEVAMVFQHYGLLPHRTVRENVEFGLKIRGEDKESRKKRALEAIERVGLKGWEDNHPNALSGGMRQRVGIARALVMDTPILLMDEPFSGLDPLIRREMQDELIRLQEELHKTIFFVTHDLNEAIRLGDRIAIMKEGDIVQTGNIHEIVRNPADDYVRKFVQDVKRQITDDINSDNNNNNEKKAITDVS